MTNANARGAAIARAAEAMLRALGGTEVTFRCPAAAAKNPEARQLGQDAPVTQDTVISPVVVRPNGNDLELLVAPSTVSQYLSDRGQTAEQFFEAVLAVIFGGREYNVSTFHVEQFAGTDYLYRVTVVSS